MSGFGPGTFRFSLSCLVADFPDLPAAAMMPRLARLSAPVARLLFEKVLVAVRSGSFMFGEAGSLLKACCVLSLSDAGQHDVIRCTYHHNRLARVACQLTMEVKTPLEAGERFEVVATGQMWSYRESKKCVASSEMPSSQI